MEHGVKYGKLNTDIPTEIPDYDNDENTDNDDEDKAVWVWNNAIYLINKACEDIIVATDNDGVRSVGEAAEPTNPTMYTGNDTFNSLYKGKLNSSDPYPSSEINKLKNCGGKNITIAENEEKYYIASRYAWSSGSSQVNFCVRHVDSFGFNQDGTVWIIVRSPYPDKVTTFYSNNTVGVRPIVTNPVNISLTAE